MEENMEKSMKEALDLDELYLERFHKVQKSEVSLKSAIGLIFIMQLIIDVCKRPARDVSTAMKELCWSPACSLRESRLSP